MSRNVSMLVNIFRIGGITMLILACMFLPFFPGRYDSLAVSLSTMAQIFGITGMIFIPIGLFWLMHEIRNRSQNNGSSSGRNKGHYFATISIIALSLVSCFVSLGAFVTSGFSFGVIILTLLGYGIVRMISRVKNTKQTEGSMVIAAPLSLIIVPAVVVLFELTLLAPATEYSRNYAIAKCAPLIDDIEAYYQRQGEYPKSLQSLWPDYLPGIIGIERYHYEPHGSAYNLYFEQFTYRFGTREIVMYNKLDQQVMTSHCMDLLEFSVNDLEVRRGYYAVHNAPVPHWKYFWFD